MHAKSSLCVALLAIVALQPVISISTEQMEKLARTLRKNCLQKIDTTEELVDGLRRGEFPDDENLACYTNCIMKAIRSFRNGAIDFDAMAKQVDMTLPPETGTLVKQTIEQCRRDYEGDPCTMSYDYLQCCYHANPEVFMFP